MELYTCHTFSNNLAPSRFWRYISPRIWLLLAAFLSLPASLNAIELTASANTNSEYTSNVRSQSVDTREDVIQRVGIEFGVLEERKRFEADANIRVDYEHYVNGTFDDQSSLRSGFGLFSVDLVEEFFNWQATFTRTDVLTDSTEDENPDTSEYRNIFRTGPIISYAISRNTQMNLVANYVNLNNSGETAIDSERVDGSLNLVTQYNALTDFNVQARYEETLESDDNEEITTTNYNAGFSRRFTKGELRFNYGIQAIESNRDITLNTNETDNSYFDLSITRQSLFGQNFVFSFQQEISDTSIGFESDEEGQSEVTGPTNAVSQTDIEKRKRYTLLLNRDFTEFAYDFTAIYQNRAFERAQREERYRSAAIGLQPKLYSRLIPRVEYRYSLEDFGRSSAGEDASKLYLISCSYEFAEGLFVNASTSYEKIDNDESAERESEEFTFLVGLRWQII